MENYIVINGKKSELTEEQLKALGVEINKDPFERAKEGEKYYSITINGTVYNYTENSTDANESSYEVANYCTDRVMMGQRALRETLNRLLWRYSMQHDGKNIDWKNHDPKWCIFYNVNEEKFGVTSSILCLVDGVAYFDNKAVAEDAIEKVIKPFLKQHPEFKW